MRRSLFLHIGGEKTGTTTVQQFLTRNSSRLRRVGFDYPCETNNICFSRQAHFPIAACLIDQKADFLSQEKRVALPFVLEKLTRRLSATKYDTILSCEHFSSRLSETRQLVALREALPADNIKIIYYIREPSDLALAAWSTAVWYGERNAFNSDLVTPDNRYYNHFDILTLWGSVFGELNLIVREYNRSRLTGGDIRKDFCSLLGINSDGMLFERDKNQSLDLQCLEVLRLINSALPDFRECESGWRRSQKIRELVSENFGGGTSIKTLLTVKEANLVKSRFGEVNSKINERYFAGRLSSEWFPESNVNEAAPFLQHRSDNDLSDVLRDTIIRFAEMNIDKSVKGNPKKLLRRLRHRLTLFLNRR